MHYVRIKNSNRSYRVGKIVCLARNYLDHIRELDNPVPERAILFCKPASSIISSGGSIKIPPFSKDCHHELELALLIGRKGKNIPEAEALSYIDAYGVALDMTLRDVQGELKSKGLPWEIAKSFDSACPLSDFVSAQQVENPQELDLTLTVNGEIRQQGNTAMMMRPLQRIVAEVSQAFTLEEGDILLTGTPAGVGAVKSGDQLVGEIEKIGRLEVQVA